MSTKDRDSNTEHLILEAAEKVFLEKGYVASRTTEIAQIAGVNHAMLHYYFRTKENLFNKVFDEKLRLLSSSFSIVFEQDMHFLEKIKQAIETHYDFLAANPRLPSFLLREVIASTERREAFKIILMPKLLNIFRMLKKEIETEIEKGTIIKISPANLLLNIGALNAASIITSLMLYSNDDEQTDEARNAYNKERKASNVDFILRSLRP
ncbi:TetR/AcrR family transcriptional regulator [Bacteroides sp. OttesenSCG-928-J23]|nr:TetR/AcrR family transcriptional regulator [Bacteroides sp. OttesenSCG-928-N06]MDL2247792.1 TetR/AcrR family transcriptional regulator [Bacteroides sp. OttesenSCG-928-J23]MDL2304215.1 TetR/AcrR family transcriptional regulator [Bacteroides sp. OttesenSCG-928-D19]